MRQDEILVATHHGDLDVADRSVQQRNGDMQHRGRLGQGNRHRRPGVNGEMMTTEMNHDRAGTWGAIDNGDRDGGDPRGQDDGALINSGLIELVDQLVLGGE